MGDQDQVFISEQDLFEFIYNNLVLLGYVPRYDEVLDLVVIFFDFLIDHDMIEEL